MKRNKITVGEGTDYPLDGLLTLPDDLSAPVPAVVLVQGSGASNMDEKVGKMTPFRDLADGLAQRGIASIRYDKRTFAHSFKLFFKRVKPTVWDETIEDALRATELLKNDKRIDPERIFIVGHSQGAMLAPRIDAEGGNYCGLILMAGSPYRLEDIVLRQLKQSGKKGSLLGLIVRAEYKMYRNRFDNLYQLSEEEAKKKKFAGSMTLYYFQEMGRKTAVDYLRENEKPVLIMHGGRDFQALAAEDFEGFRQQLADRKNVTYHLFPELNHCFVQAIYDDILKAQKEYGTERHIGPEVLDDIADFILNIAK